MKNYVYVISGEHGRQKIGSSDDPAQRIRNLQTASPFPLKFEFIGEVENEFAGQVEVEAQFSLRDHKASGGDEWFAVPPDVAMTAVMAAAHRLGYRIKPVDLDAVASKSFQSATRQPLWVNISVLPVLAWLGYWMWTAVIPKVESGEMSTLAGFALLAIGIGILKLAQVLIRWIGNQIISAFRAFDQMMHPEDGTKAPLSLD